MELGNLLSGPHRLFLRQAGYEDHEQEVVVSGKHAVQLSLKLSR